MTVKELKEIIADIPDDLPVLVRDGYDMFGYYSEVNTVEVQKVQSDHAVPDPVYTYIHPDITGLVIEAI